MSGWESYRAVHGAELRAAAREFDDHGWPVVEESATSLLLVTGRALDVLDVPAACGRLICATLRGAGAVVPVAATPTGSWWFPMTAGGVLPAALAEARDVVLHAAGDAVAAPPSQVPDGWVHWRVAPALCGYRPAPADMIMQAALDALRRRTPRGPHPDAQRSGAEPVGSRR